jgi:DNA-binding response OmpR family regulator
METAERYAFGGFVLDIGERRLLHEDRAIALAPKIFDLLVALVRRPDRLLNKRELLDAVWPDAFVEEGILSVHVSALRKALNDTADPPTYIETVRGGITRIDLDRRPERIHGLRHFAHGSGLQMRTTDAAQLVHFRTRLRR